MLKQLHPEKDDKSLTMQARFMVYTQIKSRMYIRAQPFDAIWVGYNAKVDVTRSQRELATQMFKTDRERAIREGWTDSEGFPIDNRPNVPKGLRGRRLTETFLRQIIGIGQPKPTEPLKLIVETAIGEQADNLPPLGKPVRCLLNVRSEEPNRYIANSSKFTKYEPTQMAAFPKVDDAVVCDLLQKAPEQFKSTLENLHNWHMANENDNRRVCIVEANVMFIRDTPLTTGNYLMVIEDETIMDVEAAGVTVFVPEDLKDMLNFGPGSRIIVIGRTTTGPGFNRETRTVDQTVVRTMLNAFGVWAIPEFRIPREESEILVPSEEVK